MIKHFKTHLPLSEHVCLNNFTRKLGHYSSKITPVSDIFEKRHIGTLEHAPEMLQYLGFEKMDSFVNKVIPSSLRNSQAITKQQFTDKSSPVLSEHELFKKLITDYGALNKTEYKSFLGEGYYDVVQPSVINRLFMSDPSFYTSYTPYQPEISQGRLELLLNFQTLVLELTGMDLANSSLLDEPSASVEAIMACYNLYNGKKKLILIDEGVNKVALECIKTRLNLIDGIEFKVVDLFKFDFKKTDTLCCALIQYPNKVGALFDYSSVVKEIHNSGAKAIASCDLLALTVIKSCRSIGFDLSIGSTQRFGVEMGYGGPYAAYFACSNEFKRKIPGRIVGVSRDISGTPNCYRLALQTREQHIKRQRATSNICTAQALLANCCALYAIYHGPHGLRNIAHRIHHLTSYLYHILRSKYEIENESFFDTLLIKTIDAVKIRDKALENKMNFALLGDNLLRISMDETTTLDDVNRIASVFGLNALDLKHCSANTLPQNLENIPVEIQRQDQYLKQPVFNLYHTETSFMRYVQHIKSKDVSLSDTMIPLGSCTMKLNSSIQMQTLSLNRFVKLHPYVPDDQASGYKHIVSELESDLSFITGMDGCTIHPISGAQGEYLALTMIKKYHESRKEPHREYCLIPSSAHGTNAASASMTQFKIINVNCNKKDGLLDMQDLKEKIGKYGSNIALIMITYPSTYGIFESGIKDVCDLVHSVGAQVYLDGANMNAQIGLISPGSIGADLCHLNLHKTFCIPHGGGGPGVGPVCVKSHLKQFLPDFSKAADSTGQVNGFKYGSASILLISWMYIKLMGFSGLKKASQHALLNANYLAKSLSKDYKILFCNFSTPKPSLYCAHEFIIDLGEFKQYGIHPVDVCKRLLDYSFHSPTMSWPISDGIMIEPTESESKAELDRFVHAMKNIRKEIQEVIDNPHSSKDQGNVLTNSPHSLDLITSDKWNFNYTREKAAYPLGYLKKNKKWPTTRRIDDAYGDLNLQCSCPNTEDLVDID